MSNKRIHTPKKGQGDRFIWVAYSDLSTILMLCFILIFILLSVKNETQTKKAKAFEGIVKSKILKKEQILDKLENVIQEIKRHPQCKNTYWELDRNRNSVQAFFKNQGRKQRQWFKVGDDRLTPAGRRCITLFSKRWLSTIYLDSFRGSIEQLIVEGHTDSSRLYGCVNERRRDKSNFLCNLELSQKRSLNAVKIIFSNITIDRFVGKQIYKEWNKFALWRKRRLTATGRSFADPIKTKNKYGLITENKSRSRRVEFRFTMKSLLNKEALKNVSN